MLAQNFNHITNVAMVHNIAFTNNKKKQQQINTNLKLNKMSKEKNQNKALNKTDVGGSIFFNVPLITYEKTELKLSKEEIEEFKTQNG